MYLNKKDILKAYKNLSTITPDATQQGATQKISALRHAFALDRFFKIHGRNCDTRNAVDKNEFAKLVGGVCAVYSDFYTVNFYYPLKQHNGDFSVGSNFYSAGQVKVSLIDTVSKLNYPKRGDAPLLLVQNGVLLYDASLWSNINAYLPEPQHKAAFAIWLLRKVNLSIHDTIFETITSALLELYSDAAVDALVGDRAAFESACMLYDFDYNESGYCIKDLDIKELFNIIDDERMNDRNQSLYPLQQIYFGAPGTGKSHEVKIQTGELDELGNELERPNVFRTTFHPDTDYATFVGCYKPTMKLVPTEYRAVTGKEEDIAYEFVPQTFTDAYIYAYNNPTEDAFLVIEEINRGNCAQIFGDLFQLLDRNTEGKSEYTIKADKDLAKYLTKELGSDSEGIKDGKLRLPANFHILATMNTSDQSLFPMDSAFKRRWDWKYIAISYTEPKSSAFMINVGEGHKWVDFIKQVNKRIFALTQSEDKELGNFFIKDSIDAEQFKSKVMFYLWYEVLRDEVENSKYFFYYTVQDEPGKETNHKFTFKDLYGENSETILEGFLRYITKDAE